MQLGRYLVRSREFLETGYVLEYDVHYRALWLYLLAAFHAAFGVIPYRSSTLVLGAYLGPLRAVPVVGSNLGGLAGLGSRYQACNNFISDAIHWTFLWYVSTSFLRDVSWLTGLALMVAYTVVAQQASFPGYHSMNLQTSNGKPSFLCLLLCIR